MFNIENMVCIMLPPPCLNPLGLGKADLSLMGLHSLTKFSDAQQSTVGPWSRGSASQRASKTKVSSQWFSLRGSEDPRQYSLYPPSLVPLMQLNSSSFIPVTKMRRCPGWRVLKSIYLLCWNSLSSK